MTYTPMSDEEKRQLTEAEIHQRIADLEAALADLRRPPPQEYPKWIEVAGGHKQVVDTKEEEERVRKAHDAAQDAEAQRIATEEREREQRASRARAAVATPAGDEATPDSGDEATGDEGDGRRRKKH